MGSWRGLTGDPRGGHGLEGRLSALWVWRGPRGPVAESGGSAVGSWRGPAGEPRSGEYLLVGRDDLDRGFVGLAGARRLGGHGGRGQRGALLVPPRGGVEVLRVPSEQPRAADVLAAVHLDVGDGARRLQALDRAAVVLVGHPAGAAERDQLASVRDGSGCQLDVRGLRRAARQQLEIPDRGSLPRVQPYRPVRRVTTMFALISSWLSDA